MRTRPTATTQRGALAVLAGCGAEEATTTTGSPTTAPASAATLAEVASETAGPYPAEGSNGPDARTLDGIVRRDIRSSFGDASGTAEGVPPQIALPQDAAEAVYATDGYSRSVANLGQVSLATDNVFGDDSAATELATVTGSVNEGYTATLTIAIDPSGAETPGGAPPVAGPGGPPKAVSTA